MRSVSSILLFIVSSLLAQHRVPLDERGKEGEIIFEATTAWGDRLSDGVEIRITKDAWCVL